MVFSGDNQLLHQASRINFGTYYTVEEDVKVKEIGCVLSDHIPTLVYYWQVEHSDFKNRSL